VGPLIALLKIQRPLYYIRAGYVTDEGCRSTAAGNFREWARSVFEHSAGVSGIQHKFVRTDSAKDLGYTRTIASSLPRYEYHLSRNDQTDCHDVYAVAEACAV